MASNSSIMWSLTQNAFLDIIPLGPQNDPRKEAGIRLSTLQIIRLRQKRGEGRIELAPLSWHFLFTQSISPPKGNSQYG